MALLQLLIDIDNVTCIKICIKTSNSTACMHVLIIVIVFKISYHGKFHFLLQILVHIRTQMNLQCLNTVCFGHPHTSQLH